MGPGGSSLGLLRMLAWSLFCLLVMCLLPGIISPLKEL